MGFKYRVTSNGDIRASAGGNNDVLWNVPIEVDVTSSFFSGSKKVTASIAVHVRPNVTESGLTLEIMDAKIAQVDNWPFAFGKSQATGLLERGLQGKIKDAFPTGEVLAAKLPVIDNVHWNVQGLEVSEAGVAIHGSLVANQAAPLSCRAPTIGAVGNVRTGVYRYPQRRILRWR